MASSWEKDILEEDFMIISSLGFGTFGEVKLACHLPTHTQVAVKVLEKTNNAPDAITSEVKIHQCLEHKNIVQFFHMIDTPTVTYIVMEFVVGIDLQMFLSETDYISEEEAKPIFQQIVSGVHFLHQRHIAHCDIKLENILMDNDGRVKLCDFGMATKVAEGQLLNKICGSLLYLAPEVLARKPYDGLAVDMWSLGIVLYVLLTGQFPYESTTFDGMHRIITNTKYPIPYYLSKPCRIIIAQLLMVPTKHRIAISQLLKRRWLGNIKDQVAPAITKIFPSVVESLYNIGYTCEEIMSCIKHRQPNKVRATFNILKYKLSYGDGYQHNEKPLLNINSVGAFHSLHPFKRRVSEPTFPTVIESGKRYFQEKDVEERGKRCQRYTMLNKHSCLDVMSRLDQRVSKGGFLKASVIVSATADIAVHIKSVASLPGDLTLCELALG